mmetsp:Transcript_35189/g.92088  ORF Transcript_35189/g.92088 Transcript_35189/m.92088 type:complete len:95 (-) Transcript_35189:1322-1606(-)
MGFSLGALLQAALLAVNGIAVLQDTTPPLPEDPGGKSVPRFLSHYGMTGQGDSFGADPTSVKSKMVKVINAWHVMRLPLIFVNTAVILYLIVLG